MKRSTSTTLPLALLGLAALAGCSPSPVKEPTIKEIVDGAVAGERSRVLFEKRLDTLSHDRAAFDAELKAAGFQIRRQFGGCGSWELPKNPRNVWAFVQFCHEADGDVDLARMGFSLEPMTYD